MKGFSGLAWKIHCIQKKRRYLPDLGSRTYFTVQPADTPVPGKFSGNIKSIPELIRYETDIAEKFWDSHQG